MKESYISVDIEASGPVPGIYSMLSLGACLVGDLGRTFYTELQPVSDEAVHDAMKIVGRTLEDFARTGQKPVAAMTAFLSWINESAAGGTPVFVGFNAAFDWAFVNFYFHKYIGKNPFGFGGIDIKSYYMGMSGCDWQDARSSKIPSSLKGSQPHTHNAVDDAIEQAEMFRLMRDKTP